MGPAAELLPALLCPQGDLPQQDFGALFLQGDEAKLLENAEAMMKFIRSLKPATSKGHYVRNICLAATMTPGINVAL